MSTGILEAGIVQSLELLSLGGVKKDPKRCAEVKGTLAAQLARLDSITAGTAYESGSLTTPFEPEAVPSTDWEEAMLTG